MSEIITINVGGIIYSTKRETLFRFPDSRLNHMFSPSPSMKCDQDDKGNYFIDRDGTSFRHILNFLRLCALALPQNFSEYDLLIGEAEFYGLWDMVRALEPLNRAVGPAAAQLTTRPAPPREYLMVERMGRTWIVRAHVQTSMELAAALSDTKPNIKKKNSSIQNWSSYHLPGKFKVNDFLRFLPFVINLGFTPFCPAMSIGQHDWVFVRG